MILDNFKCFNLSSDGGGTIFGQGGDISAKGPYTYFSKKFSMNGLHVPYNRIV